jgi:hypothetical protein
MNENNWNNKQNVLKPESPKLKMFKLTGYLLLIICCLLFLSIPVVPWLGFSKGKLATVTTILFITGEITFYLSLLFLGKNFFDKIKNRIKFRKANAKSSVLTEQTDKINLP